MRIADRRLHWRPRIKNWLPVIAWAGLIFFFSTDQFSFANAAPIFGFVLSWLWPGMPTEDIPPVYGVARKIGHWSEYFVLTVLILRALRNQSGKQWDLRHAIYTLIFIFLYALSDEWHQAFVPSRTASFGDVMIDWVGGICGIFWTYWYYRGIGTSLTSPSREN